MLYFKLSDFACPCCGSNLMDLEFLKLVDAFRGELGFPLIVDSGYRCPKHNAAVGGVKNSMHVKGRAVDWKMLAIHPAMRPKLVALAPKYFRGIGVGISLVHTDNRDGKPARWTYSY